MSDAPRVSFFLMTYKQEAFVKKALESIFAQEYPNLQIVISDDASPDGTQAVIEETVATYQGPHDVVVNFNKKNLLFTHLTKIMGLCDGQFIVQGHGDDIFHPARTQRMVDTWLTTGADVVTTNAVVVDRDDKPLKYWRDPEGSYDCSLEAFVRDLTIPAGFGAGMGWSMKLWDLWGKHPPGPRQMDLVWAFRGCLMGGCAFIADPLIYYRDHGDNMSMWALRKKADGDVVATMQVNERNIGNITANVIAFIDMLQLHLSRHPDDARARRALSPLIQQLVNSTRQWTHLRSDMAAQHIGVV